MSHKQVSQLLGRNAILPQITYQEIIAQTDTAINHDKRATTLPLTGRVHPMALILTFTILMIGSFLRVQLKMKTDLTQSRP
jgi:hypothetical protein